MVEGAETYPGGNIVDFLFRTESSGAAVLIETKTPSTVLLGKEYRRAVFSASEHLSGGIAQVLEYRESLLTEFHLLRRADDRLTASEPYCILIIGDASGELTDESRRQSFERFRGRIVGVRVLTFDEVFRRIKSLVYLLESSEQSGTSDR